MPDPSTPAFGQGGPPPPPPGSNWPLLLPPNEGEERRELAHVVRTLAVMMDVLVRHAENLVPGEVVPELRAAWESTGRAIFERDAMRLDGRGPNVVNSTLLHDHGLVGAEGLAKRAWFHRLKDQFLSFFHAAPGADRLDWHSVRGTLTQALKSGENILESLEFKRAKELVSYACHLLEFRHHKG